MGATETPAEETDRRIEEIIDVLKFGRTDDDVLSALHDMHQLSIEHGSEMVKSKKLPDLFPALWIYDVVPKTQDVHQLVTHLVENHGQERAASPYLRPSINSLVMTRHQHAAVWAYGELAKNHSDELMGNPDMHGAFILAEHLGEWSYPFQCMREKIDDWLHSDRDLDAFPKSLELGALPPGLGHGPEAPAEPAGRTW